MPYLEAVFAEEPFLVGVFACHVNAETAGLRELGPAHEALEGPLASMTNRVASQRRPTTERLATRRADEHPLDSRSSIGTAGG